MSELIARLGLKESFDRLTKVSSIRRYDHAMRREKENVVLKDLQLELLGRKERRRPN